MNLIEYIPNLYQEIPILKNYRTPWAITNNLCNIIQEIIKKLNEKDYHILGNVAIHKNAKIEDNVVVKNFIIIEEGAIVKSGSYLREGVYIGKKASVGANCEIKQSIILSKSRIAHLNYVGNSILGEDINLEAGAVLANHFNERQDKEISVLIDGNKVATKITKFGSLLGDGCRVGANSVLNPGTILKANSIVGRLKHIDQIEELNNS